MSVLEYDEQAILERLAVLDRSSKTVFAASCAERLSGLFDRYARVAGAPELALRLRAVIDAAWGAASGAFVDAGSLQAEAEGMVPQDADDWVLEAGYGQNAAAAAAYAMRTWMTDAPQEAAWAARQVYELADYAALNGDPGLDPGGLVPERQVLESEAVQRALWAIAHSLDLVEAGRPSWGQLRLEAETDCAQWAAEFP